MIDHWNDILAWQLAISRQSGYVQGVNLTGDLTGAYVIYNYTS